MPLLPYNKKTRLQESPQIGILLLSIFYIVGIIGIVVVEYDDFILLTPFNLLASLAIILLYHPKWESATILSLALSYVIGFFIEMIGVNTGMIFGSYAYGPVLGWKIWETPLMIGVNWAMLIYAVGVTLNWFNVNLSWWLKAMIGAIIMLLLDFLIEPVAIHYDFWTWEASKVPIQNYVSWWLISFVLLSIFHFSDQKQTNKVATALLVMQFLFFTILLVDLA